MLEGARIITLEPAVEGVAAVTFEEAFGEHSELRGRGRARRKKRKMSRINDRGEVQDARGENKQRKKNKKKSGKIGRRRMKKDSEREDSILDAENENAVAAMQPQDEESGNEREEGGYEEEAPEELDAESSYEDEESEFEAGSTADVTSSFDSETSEANGGKAENSNAQKIAWHKRSIDVHNAKIAKMKATMTGIPSNEVAKRAKMIKQFQSIVQRSTERLADLMRQSERTGRGRGRVVGRGHMNRPTVVKSNLQAKFEPNRIEVPAKNEVSDDFSGFDAKEMISKNKNVLIGVGVAAAVIVGLHFAGVFKK